MKIQVNQEIKRIITEHCIKTKVKKDFRWHYLYLVSNIHNRPYTNRKYTKDDFVPVNHEILRSIISRREATGIIKNLLCFGVLETDSKYVPGSKSRGYRIADKFRRQGFPLVEIGDSTLVKKIKTKRQQMEQQVSEHGTGYRIVNYWTKELEIDSGKAKKYINNHLRSDYGKFEAAMVSVNLIEGGDFFSVVDEKARRLHTNLTNFPHDMRKFLSVNGKKLCQVDITNSQLFFLGTLMKTRNVDKIELNRFMSLTCDGMFYEHMAKQTGNDLDLQDYQVRKDFKTQIFTHILFGKNLPVYSDIERVFASEFPTIHRQVREIKSKSNSDLAIALQKEEAGFIFKAISAIDSAFKGKEVLLTIHDSIVSTQDKIFDVYDMMRTLFEAEYDEIPYLRIENF